MNSVIMRIIQYNGPSRRECIDFMQRRMMQRRKDDEATQRRAHNITQLLKMLLINYLHIIALILAIIAAWLRACADLAGV